MFSLFYSVWQNPNTKVYQIVKNILSDADDNSSTWSINLRHICKIYNIEDPILSLKKDPPKKSTYKENVMIKISTFHENELKNQAKNNSKMLYLNINLLSLRGRHHPCLNNIFTVDDVKKLRPYLKFLTGDYLTYNLKFNQSGIGSPVCRLCFSEPETICHIIANCECYSEVRMRISYEIEILSTQIETLNIKEILCKSELFTQFILDPTSFNLNSNHCLNINDPIFPQFFKLSCDCCFYIDKIRKKEVGTS